METLTKELEQVILLEESLVIEHARRVKAEAVLRLISMSRGAPAERLRLLALQYLEEG